MKYKGFTLAEVLTTLGIIGVVAAMTIPTLMAKIQEISYKSQYKKIFSELNQALRLLEEDDSSPLLLCKSMDDKCFRDQFVKKIKISHICNEAIPNKCQVKSKYLNNTEQVLKTNVNGKWPAFMALRGYSVKFRYHYNNCVTYDELDKVNNLNGNLNSCGWVQVDVNGLSGPNQVGKDIIFLVLMQNGFATRFYTDNPINDCKKGTGISCSSLYINGGGLNFNEEQTPHK